MVQKSKDVCQVVQQIKPVKQEKVMVTSRIAKVRRTGQNERFIRKTLGSGTFSVYLLEIRKCNFQFYFMSELVIVRKDTGYVGGKQAANKELSLLLKISLLDFIFCMYIVYVYIFIYMVCFLLPVTSSFTCQLKL